MSPTPVVFVSHGSPMLPLEGGSAAPMLQDLGRGLLQRGAPRAVLVLSPHWMSRTPVVGAAAQPETLHDFGGFDPALYRLRYPAPGSPELALRVADVLRQAGLDCGVDPQRGLDHGVWVPLSLIFPAADIPVVPLAMPWPLDPAGAWRLGQALKPLRDEGVLLLGSGSLTHNLHDFTPGAGVGAPPLGYVEAFSGWVREAVGRGGVEALLDYRQRAPQARRAHPTDEHLLPLMWALGAAGQTPVRHWTGGVHYGMLSMDAWVWD